MPTHIVSDSGAEITSPPGRSQMSFIHCAATSPTPWHCRARPGGRTSTGMSRSSKGRRSCPRAVSDPSNRRQTGGVSRSAIVCVARSIPTPARCRES